MDTNRNDGQNYQINAFNKGMNTDTALDAVAEGQYIFGQNIRISSNVLLADDNGRPNIDPNSKEGLVTPITIGQKTTLITLGNVDRILATGSIGNIGVVIVRYIEDPTVEQVVRKWAVYKVVKNGDSLDTDTTPLYESKSATDKDKFSIVLNKEQENIIKLYIADGDHGIMQLFVEGGTNPNYTDDDLVSGKYFPSDKAIINGTVSGKLKTQQVQYTYRFYKRYGIFSKLAPLTNKIQIINSNRDTEQGNAENTTTTIGMSLSIPLNNQIHDMFDHLQLIRVSYVVAGQVPEISIVKDVMLKDGDAFDIVDTGEDALQELSLDEFAALNTQTLIPKVIEQNQGYMFAANVKDDTVFTVDPNDVSFGINFVLTSVVAESTKTIVNDDNCIYLANIGGSVGSGQPPKDSFRYTHEYLSERSDYIDDDSNNSSGTSGSAEGSGIITGVTQTETEQEQQPGDPEPGENPQQEESSPTGVSTIKDYLENNGIVSSKNYSGYEDIFISSMCRSLRHGETYLYGVVLYKKDGTHSDVLCPKQVTVPSELQYPSWQYNNNTLYALPVGLQVTVDIQNLPDKADIVGYEIVRCEKTPSTSKVLLTSVLSRPISEQLKGNDSGKYTPAYPQYFLNTSDTLLKSESSEQMRNNECSHIGLNSSSSNIVDYDTHVARVQNYLRTADTQHTNTVVQLFAPEILYKRQDLLNLLTSDTIQISSIYNLAIQEYQQEQISVLEGQSSVFLDTPKILYTEYKNKPTTSILFDYTELVSTNSTAIDVKRIKDVKNALWYSGFSQIDTNSSDSRIINGVKQYKTYNTSIGQYEYINWICNGLYDLPISAEEAKNDVRFSGLNTRDEERAAMRVYNDAYYYDFEQYVDPNSQDAHPHYGKASSVMVPIGPGPICFLAELNGSASQFSVIYQKTNDQDVQYLPTTTVVNVLNKQFDHYTDDQKLYTPYYGFGNFFKFNKNSENPYESTNVLFDGDVYITMCEFVTMFKAYDFKSLNDNIISNQYICRVPMESTVNTYFDYGMNYRNTQNKNLQLEPGSITNVTTQDRPLHQYNQIYSDNNTSVSVYTAQPLESRTNQFPQRICYSQHKDNGEQIDSWNIFKPVDYIDADTRYGEVTNLLSANDTIFFWQNRAFGKLSVNERSLITDNNSNTIQLGQGGVLQRTDYLSTKYGMRPEDYSAINTENGLFWIDILNKAVVANTQNGVTNYGEMLNVQNLINKNITTDVPEIDYDLQNSELLCKCFGDNQLIFNTKYNIATAIYSRQYDKILYFNNILYGLNKTIKYRQFNYLTTNSGELLSPTVLQFVVNNSPSQTKVFDNQKIVVAAKNWSTPYTQQLEFKTDANAGTSNVSLGWLLDNQQLPLGRVTDREHNICYTIPRESGEDPNYKVTPQLRMRGKWMTVKITDATPKQDFAISHIITKFRQSYS